MSVPLPVKSIPIRCLIEVKSEDRSCATSAGPVQPETESFAIVPSNSLFKDVVTTVLMKLGYSSQDASNAKGRKLLPYLMIIRAFTQIITKSSSDILDELCIHEINVSPRSSGHII